ncbi:YtxH domain-containing protein [Paenibacillus senegalensis]|uniref:YtxH domain-containing protein n=1 Tax=Paenibacillus senegalensis TaxID=1465766 RepID=UPI0002892689|nr:YtxH domain-containing protein [Paenibacillus senegalensis]
MAKNSVMVGTIVGAAVGAVSALLLAPKSGTELRKDISNVCNSITAKTKEKAGDVTRKTVDVAKSIGNHASEFMDKTKEVSQFAASEIKDTAKETAESAAEDVKSTMK